MKQVHIALLIVSVIYLPHVSPAQVRPAIFTVCIGSDTICSINLDNPTSTTKNDFAIYSVPLQIPDTRSGNRIRFHVEGISRIEGSAYREKQLQIKEIAVSDSTHTLISSDSFSIKDSLNWQNHTTIPYTGM